MKGGVICFGNLKDEIDRGISVSGQIDLNVEAKF